MGVALDGHERREPDGSVLGHPSHVVPAEIDQHQVLGALLWIGRQLIGEDQVLLGGGAARPGARDRPQRHLPLLDPNQDLGRAADDPDLVAVQVVEIGCRVERSEVAIGQEGIWGAELKPPGEHGLEGISRRDVLLDPAHVFPEARVRVRRGGGGQRWRGLEGERTQGGGGPQAVEPVLDPGLGAGVEPGELALLRVRRHLHVGDHGRAIVEVIEDQQRVGHHHDRVRQIAVIGWGVGELLDGADDVVPEIAHRAAGEAGKTGDDDRRVLPEQSPQVLERRHIGLDHCPASTGRPARALPASVAEHLAGIGRQEGVPGPALPSLERFQQEAVRAAMQLREGGHRCIAVHHHFAGHRHHAGSRPRALGEPGEGRGHRAAATR